MSGRLVVLVPSYDHRVEPACDDALRALEDRGVEVRIVGGNAAIDQARSTLATDALAEGFDAIFWIDDDIVFRPEDVERLHAGDEPLVGGIYAKKGQRAIAAHLLAGTTRIRFGEGGGLLEVRYLGAGFLYTRREVYEAIARSLPVCNERFGRPVVPYFLPMVVESEHGPWYLGEDYAFCERARAAGFRVMADTSVRLFHVGRYAYGWEDAGGERRRRAAFDFYVEGDPAVAVDAPRGESG